MWHLAKNKFQSNQCVGNLKIYLCNNLDKNTSAHIIHVIASHFKRNSKQNKRVYYKKIIHGNNYFFKFSSIRHKNSKIRILLGIRRRGTLEWPSAEVENTIYAQERVNFVPNIYAFGYTHRFLLPDKTFIATEFIEDSTTVYDYLKQNPKMKNEILIKIISSINKLIYNNIFPADLHSDNIIVDEKTGKFWVIDLEISLVDRVGNKGNAIAFILGYIFRNKLRVFFTEKEYDKLVYKEVSKSHNSSLFSNDTIIIYEFAKHNNLSRKKRLELYKHNEPISKECLGLYKHNK